MNTINGMTFYDALTKFIIGFLITFWWLPSIITKEELKLSDFYTIQSCLYIVEIKPLSFASFETIFSHSVS